MRIVKLPYTAELEFGVRFHLIGKLLLFGLNKRKRITGNFVRKTPRPYHLS